MQVEAKNRVQVLEDLLRSNTKLMNESLVERAKIARLGENNPYTSSKLEKYHQYRYYTEYLKNLIYECKTKRKAQIKN
tara:strand:+ start:400 stop:633 length:234 start_codon:yes stop_codon:yes gene_type:complete